MRLSGAAPNRLAAVLASAHDLGAGLLHDVDGAAPPSAHASLEPSSPPDHSSAATTPSTDKHTYDDNNPCFIEANGGRVWAESLPGQGTSFVVALPIEPGAPSVSAAEELRLP